MCSCSVVQESMWWNGNQIRDTAQFKSLCGERNPLALLLGLDLNIDFSV